MDKDGNGMEIDPPDLQSLSIDEARDGSDIAASDYSSESIPPGAGPNDVEENGRTYANDTYFLPNDQLEETRQSIIDQAFILFLDRKLVMASLSPSISMKILDIGTGGGDWAMAAATKFTSSSIIATDMATSVGSATSGSVPANLEFQVDDARVTPWTFETDSIDFIHIRGLGGACTEPEFGRIYREAYRCLKPNGILEMGDFGSVSLAGPRAGRGPGPGSSSLFPASAPLSLPDDAQSYMSIYNAALDSAAELSGLLGVNDLKHLANSLIESCGFRIQRCIRYAVPLGEWSTDRRDHAVGRMVKVGVLEGLEAKAVRLLTRRLGWTGQDVSDLCERAKEEILTPGANPAVQCCYTVARKLPS